MLGFLGSATFSTAWLQFPERFNPVLGFLGSATHRHRHARPSRHVSIPCWVFWVLRRYRHATHERPKQAFQSRAGFSGFCDRSPSSRGRTGRSFNPVLGFLGSATRHILPAGRDPRRFNPVLGFLGSATYARGELKGSSKTSFNPVLGFLGSATRALTTRPSRSRVSIPCWVFWVLRQVVYLEVESTAGLVSIPCWVFWVLRHAGFKISVSPDETFQSRAGFSGFCDRSMIRDTSSSSRFQSRAGFSGFCDLGESFHVFFRRVSIPCWVFWVLRPGT